MVDAQSAALLKQPKVDIIDHVMVSMRDIKAAAREIAERFHPERIILFGSHARGAANEHSDVDLMILMKHGNRGCDWALRMRFEIDFGFPIDILVRSPQEFHRRIRWGDYFLKEIEEKGITLYEAADARVGILATRGSQSPSSHATCPAPV